MEGVQDNSRLPSAKLINDESINDDITVPSSKYTRKSGGKRSKRMTTLKKPNSGTTTIPKNVTNPNQKENNLLHPYIGNANMAKYNYCH